MLFAVRIKKSFEAATSRTKVKSSKRHKTSGAKKRVSRRGKTVLSKKPSSERPKKAGTKRYFPKIRMRVGGELKAGVMAAQPPIGSFNDDQSINKIAAHFVDRNRRFIAATQTGATPVFPGDISAKGYEIYDKKYRTDFEHQHYGKFVAIDLKSQQAFLADFPEKAMSEAKNACPDGIFYLLRVGSSGAFKISR